MVASLAGGDDVDAITASFLGAENLKLQKEEEEKERRRKREVAEHEARIRELDRRVLADEPPSGLGEKTRKKRKLPRARPRLLRTAWFYSGYKFLPRSRRLFGTNFTLFQREGGFCAVRAWKP